ncbi:MAG: P-II family nitrogen regulator [Candidatus Altiarchaeia archaeon]
MKEVIAIIRPNKISHTKEVLESVGFPSMTAESVLGRGKQKGLGKEVSFALSPEMENVVGDMSYIPKRMITLVVEDKDALLVAGIIMKTNHTGAIGDGRIFVCPVEDCVRVRTGERGVDAIR